MLSISSRTARLNQDYSGNSKEKDGEVTKFITFGLDEVELSAEEVGAITGNAYIARAMINDTKDGPRPMFVGFKPLQLEETIKGAGVTIRLRGGDVVRQFIDCKVSKIRFSVNDIGTILMSCKVKTAPPLDAKHSKFIASAGEYIDVELNGSSKADQADAFERTGDNEQPPENITDEVKPKRGRPRKSDTHVN